MSKLTLVGGALVIASLLGTTGWLFFGLSGPRSEPVFVVRDGNVFLAVEGDEDRGPIADDASLRRVIRMVDDGVPRAGLGASTPAGMVVFFVSSTDQNDVLTVADNEASPVFSSRFPLDVRVVDGELLIVEHGPSSQRCFRGSPTEVDQAGSATRCGFSDAGDLFLANETTDGWEATVSSAAGALMVEGTFPGLPQLSDDGTMLIVLDSPEVAVWSATSGELLFSSDARTPSWLSGPDGQLLLGMTDPETAAARLLIIRSNLSTVEIARSDEFPLTGRFTVDGDVLWQEDPFGVEPRFHRWDAEAETSTQLDISDADVLGVLDDVALFVVARGSRPAVVSVDGKGIEREIWAAGSTDLGIEQTERSGSHLGLVVTASGGSKLVLLDARSGAATETESYDSASILRFDTRGRLLALVGLGFVDRLVVLAADADPIEIDFDEPGRPIDVEVGSDLAYVTFTDEITNWTVAYELTTGELVADDARYGAALMPNNSWDVEPELFVELEASEVRATCQREGLPILDVGDSISLSVPDRTRACLRGSGQVTVTAEQGDVSDPFLLVTDDDGVVQQSDDVDDLSARIELSLAGYLLIEVGDLNGTGEEIVVRTMEQAN